MKFTVNSPNKTKRLPVAHLVQVRDSVFYVFWDSINKQWHSLGENGNGLVNYSKASQDGFCGVVAVTIIETYYEGDTITIQF